jgi:hypothetical protein
MATAQATARDHRLMIDLENALFDRDDEAPDQPCDLVQMLGIMLRNGSRQPDQAFVIAQGRDVAGYH